MSQKYTLLFECWGVNNVKCVRSHMTNIPANIHHLSSYLIWRITMASIDQTVSYYNQEQLNAYLDALKLPNISRKPSLHDLNLIIRCHLLTFPFENTPMH